MGVSPAGKSSRGMSLALLASVLVHSCLLANITYMAEPDLGQSGVAQKNLQVVVKAHETGRLAAVSESRRAVDPVSHPNQRSSVFAPNVPSPASEAPSKAAAALAPDSREATTQTLMPVESSSNLKAAVGEARGDRQAVVQELATIEAGATRASANEMRGYRIALASSARRFKKYPPMALERGVGGRAEVLVVLMPFRPPEVRLRVSSGESSLDQAALDMMQHSVRAVELPLTLRSQQMEFTLPVEFVPGN